MYKKKKKRFNVTRSSYIISGNKNKALINIYTCYTVRTIQILSQTHKTALKITETDFNAKRIMDSNESSRRFSAVYENGLRNITFVVK